MKADGKNKQDADMKAYGKKEQDADMKGSGKKEQDADMKGYDKREYADMSPDEEDKWVHFPYENVL